MTSQNVRALQKYYPHRAKDLEICVRKLAAVFDLSEQSVVSALVTIHSRLVVLGPKHLVEYRSVVKNKHIYLFGESHRLVRRCELVGHTDIARFLEDVVMNTKDTVDIFVELPFIQKDQITKRHSPGFTVIYEKFQDCLKVDKKSCPYKNLRIHYADVRKIQDSRIQGFRVINHTLKHIVHKLRVKEKFGVDKALEKLRHIKFLFVAFPVDVERIMEVTKINKQLQNIKDREIRDSLKRYGMDRLAGINEVVEEIRELITHDASEFSRKDFKKLIKHILADAIDAYASIMDIYLLGRMFRSYQNAPDCKNIIVYAGDFHTRVYEDFLDTLKTFKQVRSVGERRHPYCINVGPFLPFFSRNRKN